ncbi:MAG TPA: ATP-binding protein [Bacteriovoracaceae bacterium]|nr:ATP-binding protein [Bacteriovoracaceae bacterium]
MAFISGPRQSGKTTLSKAIMNDFEQSSYKNWDETTFRRLWTKSPNDVEHFFNLSQFEETKLLVIDEIHKSKSWKQKLKGIYDHLGELISIIVTGSAKLSVYKKGGDSLMGRYVHFRLHPFSLAEVMGKEGQTPDGFFVATFTQVPPEGKGQHLLEALLKFSGFPEPFLERNDAILNIWRQGRLEKVVREDLRDLTRVQEVANVEALMSLLPEKVGAPLSTASLREDLEVAFDTVKRWLNYLDELYYSYRVKPYSKSIIRSLKKEPKLYLYDWTEIEEDSFRYENLVASHLLKACHYWEDTGQGKFELCYLRDKQKNEVDFLMIKNKKPWFTVECKLTNSNLDPQYKKFQTQLGIPHVQLVFAPGHWRKVDQLTWIMSAEYLLSELV